MSANQATGTAQDKTGPEHRLPEVTEAVSSKVWQVATLVIPILLTTWLTFWVSQKEDSIKEHIDTQSQLLQQQLQLSEDLYKRRFDAYEKIYTQLAQINGELPYERSFETKANTDFAQQLGELIHLSKLHMSANVEALAADAWLSAARQDGPELVNRVELLRTAMKRELDDWMLEKKLAPALAADQPGKSRPAKSSSNPSPTSKRSPQ